MAKTKQKTKKPKVKLVTGWKQVETRSGALAVAQVVARGVVIKTETPLRLFTMNNGSFQTFKYRASELKILKVFRLMMSKEGVPTKGARLKSSAMYAIHDWSKYIVGEWRKEVDINENPFVACGRGLHFFKDLKSALYY